MPGSQRDRRRRPCGWVVHQKRIPRRDHPAVHGDAEPWTLPAQVSVKDHRQVAFHHVKEVQEVLLRGTLCHDAIEILPHNQGATRSRQ